MDYLKYNCFDLAAQSAELAKISRHMQTISAELEAILRALDLQLTSHAGLRDSCFLAEATIADTVRRLTSAAKVLDQVVDIYHAAERKVNQSVEELPVGVGVVWGRQSGLDIAVGSKVDGIPASINSSDLVLEDWLLELVYRDGQQGGKSNAKSTKG